MTNGDVLHPEPLGEVAEQSTTIDSEPEVVGVDIGCSQPGVNVSGFAGGHRVGIQGNGPFIVGRLNLVALPEAALNVVGAGFSGKLPPDFLFAWTEPFSERVHSFSSFLSGRW